jgi:hypothetical protein
VWEERFEKTHGLLARVRRCRRARYLVSGAYSSKARTYRKKRSLTLQSFSANPSAPTEDELKLSPEKRAALRKSWTQLIKRVYQAEPLKCDFGGNVKQSTCSTLIRSPRMLPKSIIHAIRTYA